MPSATLTERAHLALLAMRALREVPQVAVTLYDHDMNIMFDSGGSTPDLPDGRREGKRITEALPADSWPAFNAQLEAALSGRHGQLRWTAPDEQVWDLLFAPVLAPRQWDGRPLRVLAGAVVLHNVTALQRAEEQARDAERLYRLLAEHTVDAVGSISMNGACRYLSPSVQQLTGYSPQELLDEPLSRHVHPHDRGVMRDAYRRLLAGEAHITRECRYQRKDGSWIWVQCDMTLQRDDAGRPVSLVFSARDVSARKSAEQQLADSERRHRELVHISPDVIAHIGLDGTYRFVSSAASRRYGVEPADLVGTQRTAHIHPEDREKWALAQQRLLDGDSDREEVEFRSRDTQDGWLWVLSHVALLRDANGNPTGLLSINRDITHRKRDAAAQAASERRYRMLTALSSDVIVRVNAGGVLLYVSPAAQDVCGHDDERVTGSAAAKYVHPDDLDGLRASLKPLLDGGQERCRHEFRVRHGDGHWMWVEATAVAVRDPSGQVVELQASLRDIADRRAAQARLYEARVQFQSAFEHAPVGMALAGLDGRFLQVNSALCRMLGCSAGELTATGRASIAHPDDYRRCESLHAQVAGGERDHVRLRKRYRRKDGSYFWALLSLTLVRRQDRSPWYAVCHLQPLAGDYQPGDAGELPDGETPLTLG